MRRRCQRLFEDATSASFSFLQVCVTFSPCIILIFCDWTLKAYPRLEKIKIFSEVLCSELEKIFAKFDKCNCETARTLTRYPQPSWGREKCHCQKGGGRAAGRAAEQSSAPCTAPTGPADCSLCSCFKNLRLKGARGIFEAATYLST